MPSPRYNVIGQPRFNSPLVRFFGMKIEGAAAPTLAPEIAPSFDVNQQDDPQLAFLRNEKLAAYGGSMAAAPGFYSTAAIRNPAGSGVILIIEEIIATGGGAGVYVNLSLSTISDLTSAGYCTPLDTRWGPLATVKTAARYTYRNDSAGPLTGQLIARVSGSVLDPFKCPCILVPDTAFIIETQAVNAALVWAVRFRERPIPAEELATG